MAFLDALRRTFLGGFLPSTESVQRQILNCLDGHGETAAEALYERIDLPSGVGHPRLMIDQAAQILVNKGHVEARRNGGSVDPVSAGGQYTLKIRPR